MAKVGSFAREGRVQADSNRRTSVSDHRASRWPAVLLTISSRQSTKGKRLFPQKLRKFGRLIPSKKHHEAVGDVAEGSELGRSRNPLPEGSHRIHRPHGLSYPVSDSKWSRERSCCRAVAANLPFVDNQQNLDRDESIAWRKGHRNWSQRGYI